MSAGFESCPRDCSWRAAVCFGAVLAAVALGGCERESSSAPVPEASPEQPIRRTARRAEWIDIRPRSAAESSGERGDGGAAAGTMNDNSVPAGATARVPAGVARESAWARAARGDWAEYAMQDGYRQRLTVERVGADHVSVRVEMYLRDEPLGLPAVRVVPKTEDAALDDPRIREAEIAASRETIAAGGRHWDARRVEARWWEEEVAYERVTWTAVEAPVSGLLRQETRADGELTHRRELAAFGAGVRLAE